MLIFSVETIRIFHVVLTIIDPIFSTAAASISVAYGWFHEISQLHGRLGLHFRIENIVRRSTPQYTAMVCSRSQFQSWKQNSHKFGQVEILFRNNKSES